MTRNEKNSRIRGLPPRLVLQTKDAHTGSIPSKTRIASDNRTGKFNVSFDDTNTMVFTSSVAPDYLIGGANIQREYGKKDIYAETLGKDMYGQLLQNFYLPSDTYLAGNTIWEYDTGRSLVDSTETFEEVLNPALVHSGTQHITPNIAGTVHGITGSSSIVDGNSYTFGTFIKFEGVVNGFLMGFSTDSAFPGGLLGCTLQSGQEELSVDLSSGLIDYGSIYWGGGWYFIYATSVADTTTADGGCYLYLIVDDTWSFDSSDDGLFLWNPFFIEDMDTTLLSGSAGSGWVGAPKLFDLIYTPQGKTVKGISDTHLLATPGQSLEPFMDFGNPASEQKANAETNQSGSFWITGSRTDDVGEGFEEPLWAKTKIEIDITPSQKCSIQHVDNRPDITGSLVSSLEWPFNSHLMSYWNKDEKIWEGIGSGKQMAVNYVFPFCSSSGELLTGRPIKEMVEDATIGFNPSWYGGTPTAIIAENMGAPVSNFGFPFNMRYHGTSSNLIPMSDYIDGPFLFEKAVLIFSASLYAEEGEWMLAQAVWPTGPKSPVADCSVAITTFFILNQRKNSSYDFITDQEVRISETGGSFSQNNLNFNFAMPTISGSFGSGSVGPYSLDPETGLPIDTSRDLLAYMQVSSMIDTYEDLAGLYREYSRVVPAAQAETELPWSLNVTLSSSARSPNKYKTNILPVSFCKAEDDETYRLVNSMVMETFNSSRGGTPVISGRSLLNELKDPELFGVDGNGVQVSKKPDSKNPYILLPGDNLILGWQLPAPEKISEIGGAPDDYPCLPFLSGSGWTLEWDTVPQKVVLYGSKISEGKENHDTLNQLLIANNVHEEIE